MSDIMRSDYVVDFSDLPEGCIAAIISLTSPRDACRFALVSKLFRSAADSDSVWESFLRSDYKELITRSTHVGGCSVANLLNSLSRKQLHFRLADSPLIIDHGTKSFAPDKGTGKSSYMLAARSLLIVWGDDERYWTWNSVPESRFGEVAELAAVCYLDVRGTIKLSMLSPNTTYAAYLVFKMKDDYYGFYSPVEGSVELSGGKTNTRNVNLDSQNTRTVTQIQGSRTFGFRGNVFTRVSRNRITMPNSRSKDAENPERRADGWFEVKLGEFYIRGDEDGHVEMVLSEIDNGNWKGGLIVEGIEIRPTAVHQ